MEDAADQLTTPKMETTADQLTTQQTEAAADQFASQLTTQQDYLYGVLVATCGVLSYLGNSLVLVMFRRRRGQLQPAEQVLCHLAASSLLMMLVTCPLVTASAFSHRWIFGHAGCVAHGSLSYFFGTVNITALLSVAAIRYVNTCCVHSGWLQRRRFPLLLLALVYSWAGFWSLCPLLGWGRYGIEQHRLSCSLLWNADAAGDHIYIMMASLCVICLPIVAMTFCYVKIIITVSSSRRKAHLATRSRPTQANLNLVSLVLVAGFVLAWLPYALISVLGALRGGPLTGPAAVAAATVLAKSSGWYNPVIYVCFSQSYREQIFSLLGVGEQMELHRAEATQSRPGTSRPTQERCLLGVGEQTESQHPGASQGRPSTSQLTQERCLLGVGEQTESQHPRASQGKPSTSRLTQERCLLGVGEQAEPQHPGASQGRPSTSQLTQERCQTSESAGGSAQDTPTGVTGGGTEEEDIQLGIIGEISVMGQRRT